MKVEITINKNKRTYLCNSWSMGDDMVVLHTKTTRMFINGKETNSYIGEKTIYIPKTNIDYIEVENELE